MYHVSSERRHITKAGNCVWKRIEGGFMNFPKLVKYLKTLERKDVKVTIIKYKRGII